MFCTSICIQPFSSSTSRRLSALMRATFSADAALMRAFFDARLCVCQFRFELLDMLLRLLDDLQVPVAGSAAAVRRPRRRATPAESCA